MLPKAKDEWTVEEAAHLVRRAGFGASPQDIREIHELGREKAVESLLFPDESLDAFELPSWMDPGRLAEQMREQMAANRSMRESERSMSREDAAEARQKKLRERQRESRQRIVEGSQWWFDRMMTTRAPLREKMVLFWHDHFATSAQKVKNPALMLKQNDLFRAHALGNFKHLTQQVLKDPAMMLYLDVQTSKKGKPNENFAREVMELFTLGEGNYTEQDVKEAARAFTGYTVNRLNGNVGHAGFQWDGGRKTVLGQTGRFDGEDVIDLLFEQSAAAEYLPSKLWAFFVEDEPPAVIVKDLAGTFRENNFEIEPVLREIFLSRAFYDSTVIRNQIKSPVQFLIQMCKELEVDGLPRGYALTSQEQLGQTLFRPPNVAGWDWGRAWISTNTLLTRYNIAGAVTKGAQPAQGTEEDGGSMMMGMANAGGRGAMLERMVQRSMSQWEGPDYEKLVPRSMRDNPEAVVDSLIERLFQADPGPKQRAAFIDYAKAKKGVVFTNHEVAELCHLMMSTPHYQLT